MPKIALFLNADGAAVVCKTARWQPFIIAKEGVSFPFRSRSCSRPFFLDGIGWRLLGARSGPSSACIDRIVSVQVCHVAAGHNLLCRVG
jgi:hypothetical protein